MNVNIAHIDTVREARVYGLFPEFKPLLDRSEITRAVADLKMISRTDIQRVVESIPSAWQVNAATREALVNFLSENFVSFVWAQGELDF